MMIKKMCKLAALLFMAAPTVYAGPELTGAEAGMGFHPGYNLGFHYFWNMSASGFVELNHIFILGGGLAAGRRWDNTDFDAYASAEALFPFFRRYFPFSLKTAYIYNNMTAWETRIHTLLPLASLNWNRLGGSAGYIVRWITIGDDPPLFEPIFAYSIYASLYRGENTSVIIRLANFDDFSAATLGGYSFSLDNRFRLSSRISLRTTVKADISGNVGHLTSVYGLSFAEGIIFTW